MRTLKNLPLLKLTSNAIAQPFITPPFLGGVFVCLVFGEFSNSIIADNTFKQGTTHRHMQGNKTVIKTMPHNFVLLQNAYADRVATTY